MFLSFLFFLLYSSPTYYPRCILQSHSRSQELGTQSQETNTKLLKKKKLLTQFSFLLYFELLKLFFLHCMFVKGSKNPCFREMFAFATLIVNHIFCPIFLLLQSYSVFMAATRNLQEKEKCIKKITKNLLTHICFRTSKQKEKQNNNFSPSFQSLYHVLLSFHSILQKFQKCIT